MDSTSKKRNVLKGLLAKTKDIVGTALALPKTIPAQMKIAKEKGQYDTLRRAASYGNAPDRAESGTITDAFKARSLASDVLGSRGVGSTTQEKIKRNWRRQ